MSDMRSNISQDSWYARVEKMNSLLNLINLYGKAQIVGRHIDNAIKSKFDRIFLDQINEKKFGQERKGPMCPSI